MRKVLASIIGLVLLVGVLYVHAGDSGIADPDITVTWKTNTDGKDRAAKELASLESLDTAVEACIDSLDTLTITQGVFTVVNSTSLVFIASGVTNVIDADITTP